MRNLYSRILFASLVLFGLVWFTSERAEAIVDGVDVEEGSDLARSTVLIMFGNANRCAGTIIGPRHILTAAHCSMENPRSYQIVFTTDLLPVLRREKSAQIRVVRGVYRHPDLLKNGRLSDDLAVFELNADVPGGTLIAQLPTEKLEVQPGSRVVAAGYGLRNAKSEPYPWEPVRLAKKELVTVTPPVAEEAGVRLNYNRLFINQLSGGVCQGDSGGPVYLLHEGRAPILIGTNSASIRVPGQYELPACAASATATRVDVSLGWLSNFSGR